MNSVGALPVIPALLRCRNAYPNVTNLKARLRLTYRSSASARPMFGDDLRPIRRASSIYSPPLRFECSKGEKRTRGAEYRGLTGDFPHLVLRLLRSLSARNHHGSAILGQPLDGGLRASGWGSFQPLTSTT